MARVGAVPVEPLSTRRPVNSHGLRWSFARSWAHLFIVVGGVIRAGSRGRESVAGPPRPADCHRLTSAATGLRPSGDDDHVWEMDGIVALIDGDPN